MPILQTQLNVRSADFQANVAAMASDGFEDELRSLSSSQDGQLNTSGRVAFFLKGKVKGEYLLTLSYDSDKNRNQSLFRDIRPEEYYPVYGDSAVKGYDAQSRMLVPLPALCFNAPPENGHLLSLFTLYDVLCDVLLSIFIY